MTLEAKVTVPSTISCFSCIWYKIYISVYYILVLIRTCKVLCVYIYVYSIYVKYNYIYIHIYLQMCIFTYYIFISN